MKKHISILFAVAALVLASCDDFLDIKPYGRTIPKTAEEFSALLNGMLDEIDHDESSPTGTAALFEGNKGVATVEEVCDNLEVNLTEYPKGGYLLFYIGQQSNSSTYSQLYQTISRCNMILDNYKGETETQGSKDLLGTAYALRGVAYYQLLRQYCEPPTTIEGQLGVPLVTAFDMEARPVRSSMAETIAQSEADLKKALEYHIQDEMCRFNDDVVKACLARLYFWAGRYEEAKAVAEDVLGRHPLLSGDAYQKMMTDKDGLVGNMLIRASRITGLATSGASEYLQARPISIRFLKLFPEKEQDIRYTIFVGWKRKNGKMLFAGIRSAELALIAMESSYHLGQTEEALTLLNRFRDHRITGNQHFTTASLPPVDTGELVKVDCKGNALTPLLQAILNERRKELYLEGDRLYELKRNGRPEFWVMRNGLKYTNRQFMYTRPLPSEDIRLTPALQQNPGYTEEIYQ